MGTPLDAWLGWILPDGVRTPHELCCLVRLVALDCLDVPCWLSLHSRSVKFVRKWLAVRSLVTRAVTPGQLGL